MQGDRLKQRAVRGSAVSEETNAVQLSIEAFTSGKDRQLPAYD